MAKNNNLHKAKTAKNDEFYTRIEDINEELKHYSDHFRGKIVFCNCDDPEWSNFWRYFHLEFERLGLKKLIATHYEPDEIPSYMMEYTGGNDEDFSVGIRKKLTQNGDFRSPECIELLKEADIVVTNPMFSLFREYMAQLIKYDKKFVIIGNPNAITYKEVFPLLKENRVWLGHKASGTDMLFTVPKHFEKWLRENKKEGSGYRIVDGEFFARAPAIWYTNLDIPKRHKPFETAYSYARKDELYPDLYPKYDNYDAINVDKVSQIPMDYEPCWYKCPHKDKCEYATSEGRVDNALCESACNGKIGVPITYLDKHSPEEFELIGADFELANPQQLANGKTGTGRFYVSEGTNVTEERERERADDCTAELLSEGCRKRNGVLGVPITFLDKYCPEQFRIIGLDRYVDNNPKYGHRFTINTKETYARILIQKM